jgi:hypothetical protein
MHQSHAQFTIFSADVDPRIERLCEPSNPYHSSVDNLVAGMASLTEDALPKVQKASQEVLQRFGTESGPSIGTAIQKFVGQAKDEYQRFSELARSCNETIEAIEKGLTRLRDNTPDSGESPEVIVKQARSKFVTLEDRIPTLAVSVKQERERRLFPIWRLRQKLFQSRWGGVLDRL